MAGALALVVTGTGPGLCRILDADFHEKASLVKADVAAPSWSNPTASALHHRPVLALVLSSSLRAVFWMGAVLYLGALFFERHGFGTGEVGLVYLASGFGYLAGSAAAGSWLGGLRCGRCRVGWANRRGRTKCSSSFGGRLTSEKAFTRTSRTHHLHPAR
jgi:hypothetical protein